MSDHLDSVFDDALPPDHRSGVVAVIGRPNVGKSTLMNRILGEKVAIVSPRPQTTRRQQLGIYTVEQGQILFADTPGLHKPHHKLGEYMVQAAEHALTDADIILWVVDGSSEPQQGDRYIATTLGHLGTHTPLVLAVNKVDLVSQDKAEAYAQLFEKMVPARTRFLLSALDGSGVSELVSYLMQALPFGPRYYPVDQLSEVNLRFVAAEVIREKIILKTEDEIPHSVAVEVTEFKERSDDMTYISATIYVERDSQKGIIIGKGGQLIKEIGQQAREELATVIGTKVYLELHVKVLKNWRSDEDLLRRLGYRLPKKD